MHFCSGTRPSPADRIWRYDLLQVGDILKTASSVNGDDPCLAKTMCAGGGKDSLYRLGPRPWVEIGPTLTPAALALLLDRTAIVQRERDVRPVLERTPVVPPGTVDRAGVNGSDCNAVGSGPPGQVDLLGAGSVGPVPLANGEESGAHRISWRLAQHPYVPTPDGFGTCRAGILAAPERAEATHTRISSASAAAVPPDRRELEGLPQDVCAALIQLESRIRLVEPGILLCSSPLTPPLMVRLRGASASQRIRRPGVRCVCFAESGERSQLTMA